MTKPKKFTITYSPADDSLDYDRFLLTGEDAYPLAYSTDDGYLDPHRVVELLRSYIEYHSIPIQLETEIEVSGSRVYYLTGRNLS